MSAKSSQQTGTVVQGYCVYCRSHRTMVNTIQVCNRRGRYDLKGNCSACGKAMYRLGGWDTATPTDEAPSAVSVGNSHI